MADQNQDSKLDLFDQLIYGKTVAEMGEFALGTSSRRRRRVSPEAVRQPYFTEKSTEYVAKYQEEERQAVLMAAYQKQSYNKAKKGAGMSMLEDGSTVCGDLLNALDISGLQAKAATFNNYQFGPAVRNHLAIDDQKEAILKMLKEEDVFIIKGFTGCGKTTQVPQFILDDCYENRTPCNIVVTQPRRIAAMSIAKRVCEERNWNLGTVVGYRVGMNKKVSESTLLTYLTTGCLLETLVATKSLEGFTHIIIDEVHERDEDTDFLLLVVRKFLRLTNTSTKVILMSATADAGKFAQYFRKPILDDCPTGGCPNESEILYRNAPILEVSSNEPYSVRVYYNEQLKDLGFLKVNISSPESFEPRIDELKYETVSRLIAAFDSKREITRYGRHPQFENISSVRNAVLIFLPGVAEIENMHKALMTFENSAVHKNYWYILPLHSHVTSEEQNRVFRSMRDVESRYSHFRKIILSTNIAESSLTVPDITYIIDFCLMKQLVTDPDTNFCSLKMEWAPKSSLMQRRGRVGRVIEGVVYRIITEEFYHSLPEDVTPEILRCPLEQAVLRTKILDIDPPIKMLALVIDPPRMENVVLTILTLKEMGALFLTCKGVISPVDGDLSYLGRVVSHLPIDVHLGKLIMLGYVFNILEECIIMAAGLSSKNIFTSPYREKLLAYQIKMAWAEGSFSDPITILNAYQTYTNLRHDEHFKRSGETEQNREKNWAHANFIQLKALKEMDILVKEIKQRLDKMGIEAAYGPNVKPLTDSQKALLLRVVLYGAFYPNYFTRNAESGRIDEREAVKSLCGLDPFKTVRLSNFPPNQPSKAYVRQIKNHLKEIFSMLNEDTWNAKISFDSQRVFIQFHQEGNPIQRKSVPGRICLPVYLAVKMKQLKMPFTLQLYDKRVAEQYTQQVEECGKRLLNASDVESVVSGRSEIPYVLQIPAPRLPELHENEIAVTVCHVEEPNHFWCHRLDDRAKRDFRHIVKLIGPQGRNLEPWDTRIPIAKGNLVMGPFKVDNAVEYYRAKVLSSQTKGPINERRVRLYFIDFGNAAEAAVKELKVVPEGLLKFSPLAIECYLTGVGPSFIIDPKGKWAKVAQEWFLNKVLDQRVTAKVFSVVNEIASLDLIEADGNWDNSISKQMLDQNFAVRVEESFMNKENNKRRLSAPEYKPNSLIARHRQRELEEQRSVAAEYVAMEHEVVEPEHHCDLEHHLQGPYSPLEMKMFGKVNALVGSTLKIEDDSVNSVMLEDQPDDKHERVLVAAYIGSQAGGQRVIARSTTLLPNIPGLPTLLTLIFAPRAEFRANKDRTRLTGAVCGLGYDEKLKQSFYPEHDMELTFDAYIGLPDVLLVNKIRFWLNSVMGIVTYTQQHTGPSKERIREVSQKTLDFLFQLITQTRQDVELIHSPDSYKWNLVKSDHLLQADTAENQRETLMPLFDGIMLVP